MISRRQSPAIVATDTYFEVCSCAWESLLTDCIVVDDVLGFGLGGHDGVGAGCAETGEDGAYEINGGRRGVGWMVGWKGRVWCWYGCVWRCLLHILDDVHVIPKS